MMTVGIMPDPNFVIIPEAKIAALLVCKSGATSVKHALQTAWPQYTGNPHRAFPVCSKEWIEFQEDWLKFSLVRNPFSRLESCWRDKVMDGEPLKFKWDIPPKMPWDKFIRHVCQQTDDEANQHYRSMAYDLEGESGVIPNIVIRIEDNEWGIVQDAVRQWCGVKLPDLLIENGSNQHELKWTNKLTSLVRRRYKRDFKLFGYEDLPVPPPSREA